MQDYMRVCFKWWDNKWKMILQQDSTFILLMLLFNLTAVPTRMNVLQALEGTQEGLFAYLKIPLHMLSGGG